MDRTQQSLIAEIDALEYFIYEDYGDTIEQLGEEETHKLEDHLKELKRELMGA